jgi:NCS1 family nucleobase:cation symporter-1
MGVFGANFPAMARGLVAMFWYGAQTYAASTAMALLITAVTGNQGEVMFLGMTGVMWVSFIFVSLFQIYLFWQGIDLIKRFLNFAGPAVYVVMIVLMIAIWAKAGGGLLSEVGSIFSGGNRSGEFEGLGAIGAFVAVFSIMVGYFAAVVINFGDFARFVGVGHNANGAVPICEHAWGDSCASVWHYDCGLLSYQKAAIKY